LKAIQISRTGGPELLDYVELPTPEPGPGEVLVKATAIGVNYFDTMIRTGRYRWMPKLPFVLGNELSGEVTAVGPGVRTATRSATAAGSTPNTPRCRKRRPSRCPPASATTRQPR
jgi:NADPH2:quinone reductase